MPSLKQGVSFADSPDTIRDKGLVKGRIWKLPKGTILPDGLIFNVRDFDHPLLNVNRKMKKADFIEALDKLSSKMVRTNDVVK